MKVGNIEFCIKSTLTATSNFHQFYCRCLCQFNGALFELTDCEKGCCVITVIDGDEVIESSLIEALFTALCNRYTEFSFAFLAFKKEH
jgi:hypothetical protein